MRSFPTSFQALSAVAVLWLVTATPARATLIVSGNDQTVAVGGTADLSFFISSDSNDQLAIFQLQLQITGATGQLQFNNSQPASQVIPLVPSGKSFVNDTNYVFINHSVDALFPPFWGPPLTTTYTNDTIAGGDTYYDSTGNSMAATLSSSTSLLAKVTVYANPSLIAAGESFQVALVPPTGMGDFSHTYFQDPNGNLINYQSTPVTVNVVPAGVGSVPEPPSLVLAGMGAFIGLLYSWRRRTTAAPRLIAGG